MDVPFWVWAITVTAILAMLAFDFFGHVRTPHAPTLRESATWSAIYVALAIVFGILIWIFYGPTFGGEYFAGYVTEKSLSVDNLFVFVLIMASFAVPRELQQKVLLFGIAFALVLRTIFIAVGAAAIENFSWVFYIFGAILVYTAWVQARSGGHDDSEEFEENAVLRFARKRLRTTEEYHSDRMVVKQAGKRYLTPLAIALIAIGTADIIFAVDSIPAIFGLTQEAYLVFSANAFALLGLRQLFFLIDGLLDRLVYLSYGLSVILGFIGIKLLIHALHKNELPFINGGEPWTVIPEVPISISLAVIGVTLLVTTVASLAKSRRDQAEHEALRAGTTPPPPHGLAAAERPEGGDPHVGLHAPDGDPLGQGVGRERAGAERRGGEDGAAR
ncbi:TerC family protein [Blastococcus sp. MG754426]|uniref:TerC family protein n=1 Tax=unclassified Blastococcus TaxID=2619396 RepID=UPI001EF01F7D|nr:MULTISPECIES: TerC family protein [unclassified Blastococcus]MCF6509400.1 TerC family protein [Blastococcus sp. MG754426]MCF6512782.1 TerC family protein [Blastococcus sp. MG754427]MCF6736216.1 TerC family protein [Blastococcus sp. KM273129]